MTNYSAWNSCGGSDGVPIECARTVLLAGMFAVTLLVCVMQMTRMFINTKQLISYQMAVLLLASLECLLAVIHWGFAAATAFNFWMIFLKELQLFIITYFFILSALIAFNKRVLEKRVLWPSFGFTIIFLLIVVIWGSVASEDQVSSASAETSSSGRLACANPTFIILSLFGLIVSTIFLITGIAITRMLRKQSVSENLRQRKKLELWALIFVYFVVSVTSAAEDTLDLILNATTTSCYIFDEGSIGQMFAILAEHTVNLLVPIWAIVIVYNIEASRAKGKSLNTLQKQQFSDPDESSPLDYDYLVGDSSAQSYYSVTNVPSDYEDDI